MASENSLPRAELTIEQSSIPRTARFPYRIQSPDFWRYSYDRRIGGSSSTGEGSAFIGAENSPDVGRGPASGLFVVDGIRNRLNEIRKIER